ncbi:MAG: DEAD/DEAH box helicase [Burkholderiales bacterium]
MPFSKLGLCAELLRAVEEQGYTEPTPIQAQAIPPILLGHDIMAGAQTGTGKTAGFVLPLLHKLKNHANSSTSPAKHPIRVLILTPTRELAAQVEESVRTYGKYLALKSATVFGGVNIDPQIKLLQTGIDILVATPGRLLDHVQQKTVQLGRVEILVLDEADRMLDMGFLPDIKRILQLLPAKRQNLLFSATFSDDIKRLADQLLNAPVLIEVAPRNAIADLVTHSVYLVERDRKREALAHLIKSGDWQQVLVFTRTKHGANRLAGQLDRDGIRATAIHSNKSQPARMQALAEFKNNEVRVLVATDIAARGLDIDQLPHVVNFEMPYVPHDYIHRIGQTGRAGTKGDAISLVCDEEKELVADIEKLLKVRLPIKTMGDFPGSSSSSSSASTTHRPRQRSTAPAAESNARPSELPNSSRPARRLSGNSIPDDIPDELFIPADRPRSSREQAGNGAAKARAGRPSAPIPQNQRTVAALFLPPVPKRES